MAEAYKLAVQSDPISAFGGIVALNREVDETLAECIREYRSPTDGETKMFFEIVIAPSFTPKASFFSFSFRKRIHEDEF